MVLIKWPCFDEVIKYFDNGPLCLYVFPFQTTWCSHGNVPFFHKLCVRLHVHKANMHVHKKAMLWRKLSSMRGQTHKNWRYIKRVEKDQISLPLRLSTTVSFKTNITFVSYLQRQLEMNLGSHGNKSRPWSRRDLNQEYRHANSHRTMLSNLRQNTTQPVTPLPQPPKSEKWKL